MRDPVKQLATRWVGRPTHVHESVDSTNDLLAALAASGAPAGTTVVATHQTAGRGRRNRRWLAPPATALLFSVLFRPHWPALQAHWLTMLAGLAMIRAVETHSPLQLGLKWPNDLMLYDAKGPTPQWCKTGGILLETTLSADHLQQAILGIGLNVNIPRQHLPSGPTPATSLLAAGGKALDRPSLLAQILLELETLYERADAGQSPQPAWDSRLITRNHPVRVSDDNHVLEGIALGSDKWGRLLVRDAQGAVHHIAAGDVTLRS